MSCFFHKVSKDGDCEFIFFSVIPDLDWLCTCWVSLEQSKLDTCWGSLKLVASLSPIRDLLESSDLTLLCLAALSSSVLRSRSTCPGAHRCVLAPCSSIRPVRHNGTIKISRRFLVYGSDSNSPHRRQAEQRGNTNKHKAMCAQAPRTSQHVSFQRRLISTYRRSARRTVAGFHFP